MTSSFEPVFASVSLYDIRLHKKISENFYFEFNSDEVLSFIKNYKTFSVSNCSKYRNAIFSLEGQDLSTIYLVFKVIII